MENQDKQFKKLSCLMAACLMAIIIASVLSTTGCLENKEKVLSRINLVYLDINTVLSDPEVSTHISAATREKLLTAEKVYLAAIEALEKKDSLSDEDSKATIQTIVSCAGVILDALDDIGILEKHQDKISFIRLSIKVLENHLAV